MEQWRNDTDQVESKYSQCLLVSHKSHIHCPESKTGTSILRSQRPNALATARPLLSNLLVELLYNAAHLMCTGLHIGRLLCWGNNEWRKGDTPIVACWYDIRKTSAIFNHSTSEDGIFMPTRDITVINRRVKPFKTQLCCTAFVVASQKGRKATAFLHHILKVLGRDRLRFSVIFLSFFLFRATQGW